jgi:hypothetical protein
MDACSTVDGLQTDGNIARAEATLMDEQLLALL